MKNNRKIEVGQVRECFYEDGDKSFMYVILSLSDNGVSVHVKCLDDNTLNTYSIDHLNEDIVVM